MKTNLQSLLENRLRQQLSLVDSTKLKMTWKHQVTPQGRRYLQLACSVLPIQDADFTGGGVRTEVLGDTHSFGCTRGMSVGIEGGCSGQLQSHDKERVSSGKHFWEHGTWQKGTNGVALMFEPGDFPLVNGVPNRVLKYRGYGNAIVPQVGALFTRALLGI